METTVLNCPFCNFSLVAEQHVQDCAKGTYILLDVLLCSIAEYFYSLFVFWLALHNETSNKKFIIQHNKLLC